MGIKSDLRQEYKKCCEDEVDWASIEQLHEATLQISNQCFEYKKLCVGVIGVIVAALLKLGSPAPLSIIAFVCAVIGVGFWVCDATAYYYQRANRAKMSELVDEIKKRNSLSGTSVPPVENSRVGALFNRSMSLYFYTLLVCFAVLCLGLVGLPYF